MKRRICAISLLLCLLCCFVTACSCQGDRDFDYFAADLTEYIEIPEYLYRNLHIDVELDKVTDAEIEDALGNVLCANRTGDGTTSKTGTVGYGDTVYVWYRGYLKDEATGEETDLYGTSNYGDSEPAEITVGAGGYVSGFERALVGASYEGKTGLVKRSAGSAIQEGDTVTVVWSGTKQLEDNTYKGYSSQVIRFEYTEDNRAAIEAEFGLPAEYRDGTISFFDLIGDVNVGEYYDGDAEFRYQVSDEEERTVWYYALYVQSATVNETEENRLAVAEAYFPINYGNETFNGKTVYFDFYIDNFYSYFMDYDAPALDETLIRETLGITDEELSAYEGDDVVLRYRNMVKAQLEAAQDLETATFNSLWKLWNAGVNVLKYPDGEIDSFIAEYRDDLDDAIANAADQYSMTTEQFLTNYGSEEKFARAYYSSMGDDDTVESYIEKQATDAAKEKLILYALAKLTDNVPDDEEWDAAYNGIVESYLTYYLSDTSEENDYRRENFDTEEEFLEAKEELRGKIVDYYGEAFLRESGFYQYVMEAVAKNVVEITYLGRNEWIR